MVEEEDIYIPGVCNIGKREVNRRRNFTYVLLAITVLFIAFFLAADIAKVYRLTLFLPAAALGVTFLEWRLKFCVAYAYWGYFNFKEIIKPSRVKDNEFRKLDMIKFRRILVGGILIGIGVSMIVFFLP